MDRPEQGDIVAAHDDFYFEIGKNDFFKLNLNSGDVVNEDLVDLRLESASSAAFDYRSEVNIQNKWKERKRILNLELFIIIRILKNFDYKELFQYLTWTL